MAALEFGELAHGGPDLGAHTRVIAGIPGAHQVARQLNQELVSLQSHFGDADGGKSQRVIQVAPFEAVECEQARKSRLDIEQWIVRAADASVNRDHLIWAAFL